MKLLNKKSINKYLTWYSGCCMEELEFKDQRIKSIIMEKETILVS